MAEDIENESIRISELPETTSVDKSNDCLVISKTSDIYSTGSKSYKITPQNLLKGVGVDYTAGDNITISDDNVISATIPTASSSDLGGVKVGSGLSIDSEGVLSATGGGGGASSFSDLDDVSINEHTLVNGQVPIYNSNSAKWENGTISGGSGHTILNDEGTSLTQRDDLQFKGAYSEDDSTNEKTVVNVVREMPKAEFDELTEAEKIGLINITDVTGGNDDRFQPVIYSTEEREIGVWTDGKPLYEKTVYNAGGIYGEISIQHGVSNLEQIVYAEGVCADSGATPYNYYPFSRISNDGYNIGISVATTSMVSVYIPSAFQQRIVDIYVTIRYTKTTDTAGSGQWTPQGVPAVHYSEDEHIVGTWIDGSTIYEKTWIFNSSVTCASNSWSDTPISADGIASIIDGKVYDVSNGGNLIALWGNVGISCDGIYIQILNTRNIAIGVKCMTLQYLKSST